MICTEQTTIVAQEKSDMLLDKELSSELKLNLEQYIAYLFSIKAKALSVHLLIVCVLNNEIQYHTFQVPQPSDCYTDP